MNSMIRFRYLHPINFAYLSINERKKQRQTKGEKNEQTFLVL